MTRPPTIALVGTLDTKGAEYDFLRRVIEDSGASAVLIDVGILGEPSVTPDVTREQVARLAGRHLDQLVDAGDRGRALAAMGDGAAASLASLVEEGRCDGVIIAGGSGAASVALRAFASVPFGLPKVLITTQIASAGQQLAGMQDVTLVSPVVDIAGLNRVTRSVLRRAARGVVGSASSSPVDRSSAPVVFTTMLGLTTAGVTHARTVMEGRGYEVITFHATGAGGQAMERLITEMRPHGVLDLTTVELADEIGGGTKPAGPERLRTAGRFSIPVVVAPGGTDMLRFGPVDTLPAEYRDRPLHRHNDLITLVRTTPEECRRIGERIVESLERAGGPAVIILPLGGVSALSTPDGPFHDPDADRAMAAALHAGRIPVIEIDDHINAEAFAERAAAEMLELMASTREEKT